MWLPAISGFIAVPFMVAVYLADTPYVALSMMLIPGLLHQVYLGNTLATTHNLVGLKMRATSSAILFFILNIIGLGCGPFLVGVDTVHTAEGDAEALLLCGRPWALKQTQKVPKRELSRNLLEIGSALPIRIWVMRSQPTVGNNAAVDT